MIQKTLVAGVIVLLCMPVTVAVGNEFRHTQKEITDCGHGDDIEVYIRGSMYLVGKVEEVMGFLVEVVNHRDKEINGYYTWEVPYFREPQGEYNISFHVEAGETYRFIAGFTYPFTFLKVTLTVDGKTVTGMGVMVMGFTVFFTPTMETGSAGSTSSPTNPCMAGTTGMPEYVARS